MTLADLSHLSVAVTGASGFVGGWAVSELARRGARVIACIRSAPGVQQDVPGVTMRASGDVADPSGWKGAFAGCDAVLHLAGRAHVMHDEPAQALAMHRAVNLEGTRNVAAAAARSGVRRLVFLSSIGVLGQRSERGAPLRASDDPRPRSPYARSKLEAEIFVHDFGRREGLEVTCVRPPMVYGPGAPGNLRSLTQAVRRRMPLPFGAIDNRRAFVAATHLADLLATCVHCPGANGRSLNVSDGNDISTTAFIRELRDATDGRAPLLPFPPALLRTALGVAGRGHLAASLLDDLEIDISDTVAATGWTPKTSIRAAMGAMYRGETTLHAPRSGYDR